MSIVLDWARGRLEFGGGRLLGRDGSPCAGRRAGTLTSEGYRRVRLGRKNHPEHRLVWALHHGAFPGEGVHVDDINRIRDDNRIENLRAVTNAENARKRDPRRKFNERAYS
jgi:hypothetical protein